ncbi:PREDICTED: uncharacterized protein LOC105144108 [Acromyrmex echinatior]|uniref:uncharacterized protein LOC105144108 n=1 Tax=Acromyrmex echinatior TaxID=103372 RepID=UPI00058107CE|nr:PREDICTED: uncharacterized protein LOC105144108 [Acromyrmex echinatior]XP_011051107.1 PREDICTED: uncharacterized protein LOC105144108 [Acromyrmex echinatior]
MVHYCIVNGCYSTSDKCNGDRVSFFHLPKNRIMRELWLQKIGKNRIRHKEQFARICSLHFSEDSFMVPKRKSKVTEDKRRQRLLQTAVPTLLLTPTENKTDAMINMDFKIIRREFLLVSKPSTSRDKNEDVSSGIDTVNKSCGNVTSDSTNETDGIAAASTMCSKRSPRFEPYMYNRRASATRKYKQRDKAHSNVIPEGTVTCYNTETTPLSIRRQQIFMENHNENIKNIDSKSIEIYDLQPDVTSVKTELQHCSSPEIDIKSECTDFAMQIPLELDALKQQLQEKDEQLEKISAEKEQILQLINDQTQLAITTAVKKTLEDEREEYVIGLLKPYFTEGQIRCILEKKKWIQWSIDDYAAAISLQSVSPKAYCYLRTKLHYPLPSLASLRRWALKKFRIEEGFLTDVLTVMREKGKELSSLEKLAVLSFDEMAVSSEINFDAKFEKLVGPYGKVQVMMVRGLFSNWKQPIYYKFDQPMNKCILLESITLLYNAGYQVIAIVSDMDNRGVWTELDISPYKYNKYFFHHPVNEEEKVFVFADVPHLLKLLRNWLFDDGLLLGNSKELFTREIFQTLVNISNVDGLRIPHRITQQLLDVRGSQRESVKSATRIWSHTTAKAIQWAGEHGLLKSSEYERFSEFVSTVNKWFDVHNSKLRYGLHSGVNGYGQNLETQESILLLMTLYTENIRVGSRKALMPFQKGILVSNRSLRALFQYLQIKYPVDCQYIITRRLQLDVLENFFTYLRTMDTSKDHLSAYDFKYRLRWYILGNHSQAVFTLNRNTEEDMDTTCISSSISDVTNPNAKKSMTLATPVTLTAEANTSQKLTSMPIQEMTLYSSKSNDSFLQEEETLEHTEECTDEIILTKELFSNIINISPDELIEVSNYDDNESTIDTCFDDIYDDELFDIMDGFKGTFDCLNLVQEVGLEYIAGFVAYKFKTKYPSLESSTEDASGTTSKWIETVSKDYLTNPSTELLNATKVVERYFVHFHGNYFSKESFVIKKVVALVKNSGHYANEIPHEVLHYLVKIRTYIRVREINRRSYAISDNVKKKGTKMKKITSSPVKQKL